MVIDQDFSKLSQVSATMGQNTTRTTKEFYSRIRRGSAVRDINILFEMETIPTPRAPIPEERRERFQFERIGSKYEMLAISESGSLHVRFLIIHYLVFRSIRGYLRQAHPGHLAENTFAMILGVAG